MQAVRSQVGQNNNAETQSPVSRALFSLPGYAQYAERGGESSRQTTVPSAQQLGFPWGSPPQQSAQQCWSPVAGFLPSNYGLPVSAEVLHAAAEADRLVSSLEQQERFKYRAAAAEADQCSEGSDDEDDMLADDAQMLHVCAVVDRLNAGLEQQAEQNLLQILARQDAQHSRQLTPQASPLQVPAASPASALPVQHGVSPELTAHASQPDDQPMPEMEQCYAREKPQHVAASEVANEANASGNEDEVIINGDKCWISSSNAMHNSTAAIPSNMSVPETMESISASAAHAAHDAASVDHISVAQDFEKVVHQSTPLSINAVGCSDAAEVPLQPPSGNNSMQAFCVGRL